MENQKSINQTIFPSITKPLFYQLEILGESGTILLIDIYLNNNTIFYNNMRKILLVISSVLLILLITGCFTTADKEQVPDPIIGTWHRQSVSNGIPIFGDIQQISDTPNTITFNSDGTCTNGNWKWISTNSYEIHQQFVVPNGTIKLENDRMYLTISSWWPPTSLNATYTK